jgi:hypothetical protein
MPPVIAAGIGIATAVGTAVGATAATAAIVGASVIAAGIGTVLSVVGMVTENKLLSQIGMGLSIAGAVTGVAAAAGVFGGSAAITGAGSTAAQTGTVAAQVGTQASGSSVIGAALGQTATGAGATAASAAPSLAQSAGSNVIGQATGQVAPVAAPAVGSAAGSAPLVNTGISTGGGLVQRLATNTPSSFQTAPVAEFLKKIPDEAVTQSWWQSLDPYMKSSIVLTSGQTLAGGAGGLFAGMTEKKKLALQQLIDQENRGETTRAFNQATSSPGLIQFAHPEVPQAPGV